jgi:hypothetical protein
MLIDTPLLLHEMREIEMSRSLLDAETASASASQGRAAPLVIQIVRAILWSFLGIRKRVDLRMDFEHLPIIPVIAAGIFAAAIFVAAVLLVVRLVVAQSAA